MKRILPVLLVLFCVSETLYAQIFTIGARAGCNFATLTNLVQDGQSRRWLPGLSGGISTRLNFDDAFYLVTEFNYEVKGYAVKLNSGDNSSQAMKNTYFELPVLYRTEVISTVDYNIYTEGGIYFSYWYSSSMETTDTSGAGYASTTKVIDIARTDTKYLYTAFDVGAILGGGFSRNIFKKSGEIYLGGRASFGFLEAIRYTGPDSNIRANGMHNLAFTIAVGYYFNNFDKEKHIRNRRGPYY